MKIPLMPAPLLINYDPAEERLNAYSHGLGTICAVIASVFLLIKGSLLPVGQWVSLWIYAFSLIILLASSTIYHFSTDPTRRYWFKKLDHTAIYYLIAGTYTPFLSIGIPTDKAHHLLVILWSIALIGTLFKLVFIHRFQKISLLAYLVMGWLAVFVMKDMQTYLNPKAIQLLIIGGLAYTVGAIFYALKKLKYTHAIWHVFVLIGAGAHFLAIYAYLF